MCPFEDLDRLWPRSDAPTWEIDIYSGPRTFLEEYEQAPKLQQIIFAAYWLQAEILNGGLSQFFFNDSGILAPEAAAACRILGLPKLATVLESAMTRFGEPYPREREARQKYLDLLEEDAFEEYDDPAAELIYRESGGIEHAALTFVGRG